MISGYIPAPVVWSNSTILMPPQVERKQLCSGAAKPAADGAISHFDDVPYSPDIPSTRLTIYIGVALMLIRENVPLAPFTTLGVGGPAHNFAEARSEIEVIEGVEFARSRQLPLFVLGGGSNVVVADAGFSGLVLKVGITGLSSFTSPHENILFTAGAGEEWDTLVARTVDANCAGLECLSGIPGTVGGTPVQNVGAYGQDVSETIREVRALDLHSLQVRIFSNAECGFSYRSSIFNTTERNRYIILQVSLALRRGGKPSIRYSNLHEVFSGGATDPTLAEVRTAVREIRRRKAMLIVPGDEDARSAGSFFKNPIVAQSFFEELLMRMETRGLQLPSYPASDGFRKLPAAWLVEHSGFAKGYNKGAAGISRRHALAIVNRGGATAADIIALKDEIQAGVIGEFGIELQPEPVFVGF
jgi:UDP-N-acetylmuramate dehydrogenase